MAKRVDANQADIVLALRQVGATVQHLHEVGRGCPDILVGFRGVTLVLEIKDGNKAPSKRKLTKDEQNWHDDWRGQVDTVESIDDALNVLSAYTT